MKTTVGKWLMLHLVFCLPMIICSNFSYGQEVSYKGSNPKFVLVVGGKYQECEEKCTISRSDLMKTTGIDMIAESKMVFEIVEFNLFVYINDKAQAALSESGEFTKKQKKLLKTTEANSKVYLDGIKVKGPDGQIRKLASRVITVSEE